MKLGHIGAYLSPRGGAQSPNRIPERHCFFEIIREGAVFGFEDHPVLHTEGAVFCHYDGQMTVFNSPSDSYYSCYVVQYELEKKDDRNEIPRCFHWEDRNAMQRFMDEMLHAYHFAAMDRRAIGDLVMARLRFELERFRKSSSHQRTPPPLRVATDFINAYYANPISLENVSQAAGISVSHLHMLFREHLGESPHQYLIQKRMRVASHILASSDQPIKVVSADVGYPNTENFCRAFRRFFGRSATEYRQAYQQQR
ncbi:helix-turn-helix domain-containing protein [Puniceicoccus vermicola]|uniref:Helix-turn-helix transcriptional regulator n=1 Tax=Puniceicoccus vermicola TaxID=388746 RepID=A0A7X1E6K1_9BACT|nr:AraC family transcriptional regulator [Puniceicoccus vermicola]MBC2602767.1 helix-turn-helix transcriptional regulator [Puniceicoccus vermicola]